MTNLHDKRACAVLISVQGALLGAVSPRLRAVVVQHDDRSVCVDAYFDGEIDEKDRDAMSVVETELIAAFAANDVIALNVLRLDFPAPIPKLGVWAYNRQEPD